MVLAADDVQLVRAAQAGDVAAFEELVHRHELRVYRVALRMLGSESDAEDAAQESFVQAWRALARFRGDSAFSTWLYRIVTNRCLTARQRRRPHRFVDDAAVDMAASTEGTPELVAEVNAGLTALRQAVLALPGKQRVCWVLHEVNGMSYVTIAGIVGGNPAAVRGQVQRARTRLVEAMRSWQ